MRCIHCHKPGATTKIDAGWYFGPQGKRNHTPKWAHQACIDANAEREAKSQSTATAEREAVLREMCIANGVDPSTYGL